MHLITVHLVVPFSRGLDDSVLAPLPTEEKPGGSDTSRHRPVTYDLGSRDRAAPPGCWTVTHSRSSGRSSLHTFPAASAPLFTFYWRVLPAHHGESRRR